MKILILCTGNSCRSQMAEAYLKSFKPDWEVYSAGTVPSKEVHPIAIQVMEEVGINLHFYSPKNANQFITKSFDYVITVCGDAKEKCPYFTGEVKERLHIGFDDPAIFIGTEEETLMEFRKIRDEIMRDFSIFVKEIKDY